MLANGAVSYLSAQRGWVNFRDSQYSRRVGSVDDCPAGESKDRHNWNWLNRAGANSLSQFRANLLAGASGVRGYEIRYVGETLAGVCNFDELRHQTKKEVRRGTRAGSIGIYCAQEAIADSGLDWPNIDKIDGRHLRRRHRARQRRNRKRNLRAQRRSTTTRSSGRTITTRAPWPTIPAGEISLNLGITGPHYTIGAACAAGNAGLIQGAQMLRLGECDVALAGGVSESIHTFGIFASFKARARWPGTTTRRKPRGRSTSIATASSWPKAAACTCSSA